MLVAYDILNFGQIGHLNHLTNTISSHRVETVEDPVDQSRVSVEQ